MDFKKTILYIFLAYFGNFEVVTSDEDSPSVIILGAGASGIAAASRLFENGFKQVTILEAENRIGGRIHTTKFNRYLVDLGANWVFEPAEATPSKIDWPFNLMEREYCGVPNSLIYDSSGMRLDDNVTATVEAAYEASSMTAVAHINKKKSVCEFKAQKLAEYLALRTNIKETKGLTDMILMLDSASFGADIEDLSTKTYMESTGRLGHVYNWKNRGYSTMFDAMMKRYPNPAEELPIMNNTIFNAKVSVIENNSNEGKVIIKTTDGKAYCADHVIVTIPLGVLKAKYDILFSPPLPEEKVKTIKGLGFGNAEKIFLFFKKPFWNHTNVKENDFGFNIFWKDSDRKVLRRDPERSWLLGLHEFTFVPHRPNVLLTRVSGKYSQDMAELSDQQVFNHLAQVLRKFFGRDYNIERPTEIIRSKWHTNKNFRGSCTYYKLEKPCDDDVFIEDLAKPIGEPKPKILFAGEATHPHFFGTARGAIHSGYREAGRLTELYPHLLRTNAAEAPSTSQQNDP